ncbi:MAG: FtsX-like permease family protein [Actinomycetota bacterium]
MALAFIIVVIGIVTAGPLLTVAVAAAMARLGRRAPALVAARHLQANPAAAFRAISGLVLATFVATVISGVTPSVLSSSGNGYRQFSPGLVAQQFAASYLTPRQHALTPGAAASLTRRLRAVPGVIGVAALRLPPPGTTRLGAGTYNVKYGLQPVVARCGDLRAARVSSCPQPGATVAADGSTLATGSPGGPAIMLIRPVPATALAGLPLVAVLVATGGNAAAIEQVRSILDAGGYGQVGPAITSADVNAASNQRLARLEQLANGALLITLIIAGCSLAVAVAGSLAERQRPFALLRLTGMRRSDLSRIVLAEAALPLLAMAVASVLLGFAVSAALLLAAGHGTHLTWKAPQPTYWAALGAGLATALLVVTATLPLLHRLTSPEAARFE